MTVPDAAAGPLCEPGLCVTVCLRAPHPTTKMLLLDRAVKMAAELDEPLHMNFVRKHALEQAAEMGLRKLTLNSSTRLPNAVHLYESVGFHHLPKQQGPPSEYLRTDVVMEMDLPR